jgi:hypothetical protein
MAKKEVNKTGSTEKLLLENFISLQKVLTDLSMRLDENSKKVSRLLELFELAGKSYDKTRIMPQSISVGGISDLKLKEISDKLDSTMEQIQVIAKGIILLEDVIRTEKSGGTEEYKPKPLPEM